MGDHLKSAVISPCGTYRYRLERRWPVQPSYGQATVIMVNPSTADAVRRARPETGLD